MDLPDRGFCSKARISVHFINALSVDIQMRHQIIRQPGRSEIIRHRSGCRRYGGIFLPNRRRTVFNDYGIIVNDRFCKRKKQPSVYAAVSQIKRITGQCIRLFLFHLKGFYGRPIFECRNIVTRNIFFENIAGFGDKVFGNTENNVFRDIDDSGRLNRSQNDIRTVCCNRNCRDILTVFILEIAELFVPGFNRLSADLNHRRVGIVSL